LEQYRFTSFEQQACETLLCNKGNYLSCPSFKEVKVLIYLMYLKRLSISKGIEEKSFYFSSLILLTYSFRFLKLALLLRANFLTPFIILIRFKLEFFLNFFNS